MCTRVAPNPIHFIPAAYAYIGSFVTNQMFMMNEKTATPAYICDICGLIYSFVTNQAVVMSSVIGCPDRDGLLDLIIRSPRVAMLS